MTWSENLSEETPAYRIAASTQQRIRVVAGPGTGKSFAMKRRVARLLEGGIDPRCILPVTFTRVAAEDLHRELVSMGVPGCETLEGTTLHSLAMRILMRNHVLESTGRTPRPLNEFEIKPLEADLAASHGGVRELRKKIKAYEAAWARLQRDDPGYVQSPSDLAFENDLLLWLKFHRAMLIGEVIPSLYSYLTSNPAAPERREFTHILVDEYQDLNKAEQGLISLLSDNAEVCIVGDDDQSIYSFKHAHPDGIRDWLAEHTHADDLSLDECRRCPTQVVEMANHLIACNMNRPVPRALTPIASNGPGDVRIIQYNTLGAEVIGVADAISALIAQGAHPGDILVLAQRGVIGTPIYEELKARGVPVRSYYAETELDAQDAQRRFALLKLFVDREDRVALRWLLGLGSDNWLAGNYSRLRNHCEASGLSPWQALEQLETGTIQVSHTGRLIHRFIEIRNEINALEALSSQTDLSAAINHLFPENDPGVRDLRALALNTLEAVGADDRERFLRELTTAIAKPEIPAEIEDVRIMSLHKSKGLSAPVTIIGDIKAHDLFGSSLAQPTSEVTFTARHVDHGLVSEVADAPEERIRFDPCPPRLLLGLLILLRDFAFIVIGGHALTPALAGIRRMDATSGPTFPEFAAFDKTARSLRPPPECKPARRLPPHRIPKLTPPSVVKHRDSTQKIDR